ncbi:FAD binding domain-containing protein, partial [Singulisphaera rosea]
MQSRRDFLRISGVAATLANGASYGGEANDEIDWNLGFFQPGRLETALAIRERLGGEVIPVAGGTLVGRLLQSGELGGRRLLDLTRIDGISSITKQEDTYTIFPGVSFRTLEEEAPLGALAKA